MTFSSAAPSPAPLLVRGSLLYFLADPGPEDRQDAYRWHEDGGLWIEDGRVRLADDWDKVLAAMPVADRDRARRLDYRGRLILPGLVDAHLHYPQAGVIASFGRQLLDWLNDYTFPAEAQFADPEVAERGAEFVLDRLLAHGTTTASVFATVHPGSADAFFQAAARRRLRMLCGKVMMDRNCPDYLQDTAADSERDCRDLIERWHGRDRLGYTLTPRFAPTSTPEQLAVAGALYAAYPDLHLQTHLSENKAEIAWVRELFPDRSSYLDAYDHYGLLGPRSIYAHAIHLDATDRQRLGESGSAVAFCPTSNLFLGSGFFDLDAVSTAGVRVGLATDVGGGTSYSLIRTLGEAYKVAQFKGTALSALRGWYLATLGGARALYLEDRIGSFQPGREGDFVVLDWAPTPELAFRQEQAKTLEERLFALMILGDERCVVATHVLGEAAYRR